MTTFKTFTDHKEAEAYLKEQSEIFKATNIVDLIETVVDKSKAFQVMLKRGYGETNPDFQAEVDELGSTAISIMEAFKVARVVQWKQR